VPTCSLRNNIENTEIRLGRQTRKFRAILTSSSCARFHSFYVPFYAVLDGGPVARLEMKVFDFLFSQLTPVSSVEYTIADNVCIHYNQEEAKMSTARFRIQMATKDTEDEAY